MSTTKTKRTSLMRRADRDVRQLVIERDGCCQMCGGSDGLQAAHFFPRRYRSVRWDLDNLAALCSGPGTNDCHRKFDSNDALKWEWIRTRLGEERYRALIDRKNEEWDRDYDAVFASLQELR